MILCACLSRVQIAEFPALPVETCFATKFCAHLRKSTCLFHQLAKHVVPEKRSNLRPPFEVFNSGSAWESFLQCGVSAIDWLLLNNGLNAVRACPFLVHKVKDNQQVV